MFLKIILIFFIGLISGFILEFSYRSIQAKKIITPKLINIQMYGLAGAFLVLVHSLNISIFIKLILMFVFPTLVELLTGYLYLKFKGIYLWDYSNEPLNFKSLICLKFSIYWFITALIYYLLVLPLIF